jgi:hypothetical protein
MADPQVIQCSSACTVTVVHELHIPVLDLTIGEGQMIGGAIVLVWAIGYGFRVVSRQIQSSGHNHQESE